LDPYLIATWSVESLWDGSLIWAGVAVALGTVIFVHELGHFAVAKLCGVKCEKFYLGFDIYGLKLFKFRWGETEYGIGILPLGGYVKMLGQEDNPAKVTEELERAKLRREEQTDNVSMADATGEAALDPRSYPAQSVPKRMAIISAGVVMNVIFAFVAAMVAFGLGVEYIPCGVSYTLPGEPAWRAGLQVGDRIVEIDGLKNPRFQDLQKSVMLGDLQRGVALLVERESHKQPIAVTVFADNAGDRLAPTIGILNQRSTTLLERNPTAYGSPASRAKPGFEGGDRIVAINDTPVKDYADIQRVLARNPSEKLRVAVFRPASPARDSVADGSSDTGSHLTIDLAANPMRVLGLVMEMGKIEAVQADSPAADAGLRSGDFLLAIDGEPVGDPMTLPERLRRLAGQTISLSVSREGHTEPLVVQAKLRNPGWFETPTLEGHPMTVPALGIAYRVSNRVRDVEPDSPAAAARITSGDELTKVRFIIHEAAKAADPRLSDVPSVQLSEAQPNWPFCFYQLQALPRGTKIELEINGRRKIEITPEESSEWFFADRGFVNDALVATRTATTLSEAATLGWRETVDSVAQVYLVIRRMIGKQVSPKALSGPVGIVAAAGQSAQRGLPELLLFLTLLSANLAVINFLPIPLLDGGHMIFLALEGARGKPADERVVLAFHYAGFCFIIGLLLWVLFLDVGRLAGG